MHIIFTANDPYVKYIAVCITSLVKNLSPEKPTEPITFHLLTDGVSDTTQNQLNDLAKELSQIAPLSIQTYVIDDTVFASYPKWCGSYLAYYRLQISTVLPKDTKKALYLDADTLINCDIRELYNTDLEGKVLGAAKDCWYPTLLKTQIPSKMHSNPPYTFNSQYYFNSGVLLIDLEKWIEYGVEKQCLEFLDTYTPTLPDQDALNAICADQLTKFLPFAYDCLIPVKYNNYLLYHETQQNDFFYLSFEEYEEAIAHPKIIHYSAKPWKHPSASHLFDKDFNLVEYPNTQMWWDFARQTPSFCKDLMGIKYELDHYPQEKIHKAIKHEKKRRNLEKKPIWYQNLRKSLRSFRKLLKKR